MKNVMARSIEKKIFLSKVEEIPRFGYSPDEFAVNHILKEDVDAEGPCLTFAPLVMRVNINVVPFDQEEVRASFVGNFFQRKNRDMKEM